MGHKKEKMKGENGMIVDNGKDCFSPESGKPKNVSVRQTIQKVYAVLKEKGYHPINQLVGYILSEDPTYITDYGDARALITGVGRDRLLVELIKSYLDINE